MQDITDRILDDHETFRRAFAEIDVASSTEDAARLWARLSQLLELHAAAEEEVFYPELLREGSHAKDETKDAIKDHNQIRDAVRRAAEAETGSERWRKAIADAREANSDHMAEEERGALADFRRNSEAQERGVLAERWDAFKRQHPGGQGVDESDKSPKGYIAEHSPSK